MTELDLSLGMKIHPCDLFYQLVQFGDDRRWSGTQVSVHRNCREIDNPSCHMYPLYSLESSESCRVLETK